MAESLPTLPTINDLNRDGVEVQIEITVDPDGDITRTVTANMLVMNAAELPPIIAVVERIAKGEAICAQE